jgi:hypothetical protein
MHTGPDFRFTSENRQKLKRSVKFSPMARVNSCKIKDICRYVENKIACSLKQKSFERLNGWTQEYAS